MTTTTEEKKITTKKTPSESIKKKDSGNLIVIYNSLEDFLYPRDDVFYLIDPENPSEIVPYILRPGVNIVNEYYTNIFLSTSKGKELFKKNKIRIKCKHTQRSIVELDVYDKEEILSNSLSIDFLKEWGSFDMSYVASINTRINEILENKDQLITISPTKQK